MAADEVLNLFDSNWFGTSTTSSREAKTNPSQQVPQEDQSIVESSDHDHDQYHGFSLPKNIKVRSLSEQLLDSKGSFFSSVLDGSLPYSPSSVLITTPRLQTIFSGKEVKDFPNQVVENSTTTEKEVHNNNELVLLVAKNNKKASERSRTKSKRKGLKGSLSKSLSALEFEELKGFMDLGFVFTEEECKDSKLVSIIPGLQRFGKKNIEDGDHHDHINHDHQEEEDRDDQKISDQKSSHDHVISRPYLSEAWDVLDFNDNQARNKEKQSLVMMNWKIPTSGKEIDIKDHIRFWAHSVASTVR